MCGAVGFVTKILLAIRKRRSMAASHRGHVNEKDPAKRLSAKAAAEMAKAWVRSFRTARAAESTEGGGGGIDGGIDSGIRIDGGGGDDDDGGIDGGTRGDGGIDGTA